MSKLAWEKMVGTWIGGGSECFCVIVTVPNASSRSVPSRHDKSQDFFVPRIEFVDRMQNRFPDLDVSRQHRTPIPQRAYCDLAAVPCGHFLWSEKLGVRHSHSPSLRRTTRHGRHARDVEARNDERKRYPRSTLVPHVEHRRIRGFTVVYNRRMR